MALYPPEEQGVVMPLLGRGREQNRWELGWAHAALTREQKPAQELLAPHELFIVSPQGRSAAHFKQDLAQNWEICLKIVQ